MELRTYQRQAVDAVKFHLQSRRDNPCVEIPTGGGKSLVIATLASEFASDDEGRVLVLSHVRELVKQNADALTKARPDLDVGVYSAGLNSRCHANRVVVASIQSIATKACHFADCGLIVIDEAHRIQPKDNGQYAEFVSAVKRWNPGVRIVGMTATPFRMSSGPLCSPGEILNHVCFRIGILELIDGGFLSPIISKRGLNLSFDGLKIDKLKREFEFRAAEQLMTSVVPEAVSEILKCTVGRRSTLLFCQSLAHAGAVLNLLKAAGESCGYVDATSKDRDVTLANFKSGDIRYLVNVDVLTTGFDAPGIDCVAILRPTASAGLYYQMVGRGFRISPGKSNCLILDFGGNVERHGFVDCIDPNGSSSSGQNTEAKAKVCTDCGTLLPVATRVCPECQFEFEITDAPQHDSTASTAPVLSINDRASQIRAIIPKWNALNRRPLTIPEFFEIADVPVSVSAMWLSEGKAWIVGGRLTWEWFCSLLDRLDGNIVDESVPKVTVVKYGQKFLRMQYRDPGTGKVVVRSTGTADRQQADAAAQRWQIELLQGALKPRSQITVGEVWVRYEREHLLTKAVRTQQSQRHKFAAFLEEFSETPLSTLSAFHIAKFKDEMRAKGLAEATVGSTVQCVFSVLNWSHKQGLLSVVPTVA